MKKCLIVAVADNYGIGVNGDLPWVNVCDGLGTSSRAVALYNLQTLPTTILIAGDEISSAKIDGEAGLRRERAKLLK